MKTTTILLLSLALLPLAARPLLAAGAETVSIKAYDTMKFSVTMIEAKPGEKVTVELQNAGSQPKKSMGHNWILLKAGSSASDYANAAIQASAQDYQPSSLASEVLASIHLLGPKESAKTTFTAPTVPGSYPFLCSFPAHYQSGMHGKLIVK